MSREEIERKIDALKLAVISAKKNNESNCFINALNDKIMMLERDLFLLKRKRKDYVNGK